MIPTFKKGAPAAETGFRAPTGPDSHEPSRIVTVLAISPFEEDHIFLNHVFSHSNWRMCRVQSAADALDLLREKTFPVALCDGGDWKDLLAGLQWLANPPVLVVASRLADEHLWGEVLNLGGYDVLSKPFDRLEVVRVISLAWLHWKECREQRLALGSLASALAAGQ
jgi:DNA-binding response OmpR family regulator